MKILITSALLLALQFITANQNLQARSQDISSMSNAALRRYVPNLYQTLRAQHSSGTTFIEYLENISRESAAETTWYLPQKPHYFLSDLIQIFETITGDASWGKKTYSTISVLGSTGTRPLLLIAAGFFYLGKRDIAFQVIGNENKQNLHTLNRLVRSLTLKNGNRFHLHQTKDLSKYLSLTSHQLRKPDIAFFFEATGSEELSSNLAPQKPLIFDFVRRTVQ